MSLSPDDYDGRYRRSMNWGRVAMIAIGTFFMSCYGHPASGFVIVTILVMAMMPHEDSE